MIEKFTSWTFEQIPNCKYNKDVLKAKNRLFAPKIFVIDYRKSKHLPKIRARGGIQPHQSSTDNYECKRLRDID